MQALQEIVATESEVRPEGRRAERSRLHPGEREFGARRTTPPNCPDIIARSPQMLHILDLAGRVAAHSTPVLITGESGTGKDALARFILSRSSRARGPMVSLNCAAIPETLVESELFGRRGAFTGALADKPGLVMVANGGTLFLDEIAEIPYALQAKLLRFVENGTYLPLGALHAERADVRILAATNASLVERMDKCTFRSDLYYRLAVFPIHIPPLRERVDDIALLAHHFLERLTKEVGRHIPGFSEEAMNYLASRSWPGNVRELRNAIERAVIISDGSLLTSAHFRSLDHDLPTARNEKRNNTWELPESGVDLPALNRNFMVSALTRTHGNVSNAARLLGLTRPVLRYRLKKYGLAC